MHSLLRIQKSAFLAVLIFSLTATSYAGPPFLTDDPEPVELHHWEFYLATQQNQASDGWSGTAPHFEVNYGAVADLQLHMIAPLAYDNPKVGSSHYGLGDMELGFKYRFVHETETLPQIAIFPLIELPTGDDKNGLGNGKSQAFKSPLGQRKKSLHQTSKFAA